MTPNQAPIQLVRVLGYAQGAVEARLASCQGVRPMLWLTYRTFRATSLADFSE